MYARVICQCLYLFVKSLFMLVEISCNVVKDIIIHKGLRASMIFIDIVATLLQSL